MSSLVGSEQLHQAVHPERASLEALPTTSSAGWSGQLARLKPCPSGSRDCTVTLPAVTSPATTPTPLSSNSLRWCAWRQTRSPRMNLPCEGWNPAVSRSPDWITDRSARRKLVLGQEPPLLRVPRVLRVHHVPP